MAQPTASPPRGRSHGPDWAAAVTGLHPQRGARCAVQLDPATADSPPRQLRPTRRPAAAEYPVAEYVHHLPGFAAAASTCAGTAVSGTGPLITSRPATSSPRRGHVVAGASAQSGPGSGAPARLHEQREVDHDGAIRPILAAQVTPKRVIDDMRTGHDLAAADKHAHAGDGSRG